jgi:hypothetical protein
LETKPLLFPITISLMDVPNQHRPSRCDMPRRYSDIVEILGQARPAFGRLRIAVDAHYGCEGCDLLTHVEFRSNRFPALEGEEKLINPDLWGKQLADFLRDGLRTEGFETTEPIAEDWGWRLNVINDTFALWIGCGHYQEYDDGYLCFIEPHEPFVWKPFRRVGTRDRVAALQQAMNKVLGEDVGIRAMRWWTYEDFNHPSRFTAGPNR